MRRKGLTEAIIVVATAGVLAVAMTYPLAFEAGSAGRIETGDGQWSIWVVNWVARTLVVDPLHVFDANIFHPHRGTLAYSETNLVAGALAAPAYWATRNPYLAHNLVLLLAFVLSSTGGYYLARYLTRWRPAAALSAVLFAFCPYVFAHTAHIHLLLTAGLPFSLLAFHRLADRPTIARGAALGALLALTGLSCGYYGVYGALLVSFASLYYLAARHYWTNARYYLAVAVGALVAVALLAPFVKQYLDLGEGNRPVRGLQDQYLYAANWWSYLASGGFGHRWLLSIIKEWREVIFPGFTALVFAGAGIWAGVRAWRTGSGTVREGAEPRPGSTAETVGFYSLMTVAAFWLSFGPKAGLYSLVYWTFPFFSLLRSPARLGSLVVLGVAVLAGVGLSHLLRGRPRAAAWAAGVTLVALVETTPVPIGFKAVPPLPPVYRTLAVLPPGALLEMPFFWRSIDYHRHTYYMRLSTAHWKPLVNGYSDHFPHDFAGMAVPVHWFPTREAFDVLRPYSPRYVLFHLDFYDRVSRPDLLARIEQFRDYLRPLAVEKDYRLYEIVGWPDR